MGFSGIPAASDVTEILGQMLGDSCGVHRDFFEVSSLIFCGQELWMRFVVVFIRGCRNANKMAAIHHTRLGQF